MSPTSELRGPRERPPQKLTRQRTGVLAVAQQDLAIDDRRRDPARALHETKDVSPAGGNLAGGRERYELAGGVSIPRPWIARG